MAMEHWLYSHKVVVAYFQRKVIKYDSKGVETVLMAYTKFKGRFVILRSFQNQSTDFVLSTTCLADEFTVEKSCENFVIHPFNLSLKKKLNDARTKEGTK